MQEVIGSTPICSTSLQKAVSVKAGGFFLRLGSTDEGSLRNETVADSQLYGEIAQIVETGGLSDLQSAKTALSYRQLTK